MNNMTTQELTALAMKLRTERAERWKVEGTEEYIGLQNGIALHQVHIEANQAKQKELLSSVPDSTQEYEDAKREFMEEMRSKGIEEIDNVVAKFKVKNEVNTRRVMEGLGGDLDSFYLLAKIQQVTLKEFCKSNPDYKSLMGCIEEIDREMTDITISLPE